MTFVEQGSPEWDAMWTALAEHELNKNLDDPRSAAHHGECWQYMGTDDGKHCFRHRFHPVTNERVTVHVTA